MKFKFFAGLVVLIIALALQFLFASAGIFLDLSFAALICFAFLFDLGEFLVLVLVAVFVVNWQPAVSTELLVFSLFPVAMYFLRRVAPWHSWVAIPVAVVLGTVLFYFLASHGAFPVRAFFMDVCAGLLFDALVSSALRKCNSHHAQRPGFEDSLSDDWSRDLDVAEVPIGNGPFWYLGLTAFCLALVIAARITYLDLANGAYYSARANDNVAQYSETPAPRGTIYDREGNVLAESKAAFAAVLDTRAFVNNDSLREDTARIAESVLGIAPNDLTDLVNSAAAQDFATPVVLDEILPRTNW